MAGLNSCQARLFPAQGPPRAGVFRPGKAPSHHRSRLHSAGAPPGRQVNRCPGPQALLKASSGPRSPLRVWGSFQSRASCFWLSAARKRLDRGKGGTPSVQLEKPQVSSVSPVWRGPLRDGRLAPPASSRAPFLERPTGRKADFLISLENRRVWISRRPCSLRQRLGGGRLGVRLSSAAWPRGCP